MRYIYAAKNSIEELIKVLERESKSAIDWFKINYVIVNPDTFQAKIKKAAIEKENKYDLNVNNSIIISSVDSVTLLGIEIDNKLNLEKHVSTIISFYIFLSRQYSLLYMCLYIVNVFKYLFLLSENKESYLYYYDIKVEQFSLDPLPRCSRERRRISGQARKARRCVLIMGKARRRAI